MSVKHTTVSILPSWFSVLNSNDVFLYWYLYMIMFFVSICTKIAVISPVGFHKYLPANLNVPSP